MYIVQPLKDPRVNPFPVFLSLQAQPFYAEDINAGSGDEPDITGPGAAGEAAATQPAVPISPFMKGRAAIRAASAQRLGEAALLSLVQRIEGAYSQVRTLPLYECMMPSMSHISKPADARGVTPLGSWVGCKLCCSSDPAWNIRDPDGCCV